MSPRMCRSSRGFIIISLFYISLLPMRMPRHLHQHKPLTHQFLQNFLCITADSEEDEELAARLPPLLTPLQSQLDTIQRLTAFATAPSAPSSASPDILRIHGPPGSGKTSILASLCAELASSASPPNIVYVCLREGRGPGYLSAHLCSQLGFGSVSLSACMQRQATRTVIIVDGVVGTTLCSQSLPCFITSPLSLRRLLIPK